MKDLPKVFVNKIDKEINNSLNETKVDEERKVNLDDILTKDKYSFNHKYLIKTKTKIVEDSIIQITNNQVLTIENGWINIGDILSIIEIKK